MARCSKKLAEFSVMYSKLILLTFKQCIHSTALEKPSSPETVIVVRMCLHRLQVTGSDRQRFPPPPLSTLEMQKKATGSLRIGGDRVMKLAEELYQSGYISYPRTETDTFDSGYDLMVRDFRSSHIRCVSLPMLVFNWESFGEMYQLIIALYAWAVR